MEIGKKRSIGYFTVDLQKDTKFDPMQFDENAKRLSPPSNIIGSSKLRFVVHNDVMYIFNPRLKHEAFTIVANLSGSDLQYSGNIYLYPSARRLFFKHEGSDGYRNRVLLPQLQEFFYFGPKTP